MLPKAKTVYFHVDVNSAFLSWTAIQHLANGETLDLRTVPAVVGGDEEKRHGVVLAKSIPAKRYGIQTGESLFMARSKYPNLIVAAPDFDWYVKNSKAMIRIFGDYTPDIEQYSIDEAFLNMTGSEGLFGPPLQAAQTIKDRIHRELGFTVNIGIAPNRLLAKMASDFEKPDKIHVLTQDMVPQKLAAAGGQSVRRGAKVRQADARDWHLYHRGSCQRGRGHPARGVRRAGAGVPGLRQRH